MLVFVAQAGSQAPEASHTSDFCNDVLPIFTHQCATGECHAGVLPAEGLILTTPAGVLATAVGRTAQGANTGTIASPPEAPGIVFGVDTPIVDPGSGAMSGGDPADSWLLYKVLLGLPSDCSAGDAGLCEAGSPVAPSSYLVPWQPLSDDARATLGNLVQGEIMPPTTPLTLDEMETLSFWISEGALVPASCN
jgi:hypothetical protein